MISTKEEQAIICSVRETEFFQRLSAGSSFYNHPPPICVGRGWVCPQKSKTISRGHMQTPFFLCLQPWVRTVSDHEVQAEKTLKTLTLKCLGRTSKGQVWTIECNVFQYFPQKNSPLQWMDIVWIFIFLKRARHFTEVFMLLLTDLIFNRRLNIGTSWPWTHSEWRKISQCVISHALSLAWLSLYLTRSWKTGCRGLHCSEKSAMPPLCTPAEHNRDACRVMNTFQLPSRPVTQGHVGTVALGPLRKADSYTVTVLERTALWYQCTTACQMMWFSFFSFFFMNAPLVCKRVKSLFFLSTSAAKNKISHLEVLVEI